jgi:hypothetical protein
MFGVFKAIVDFFGMIFQIIAFLFMSLFMLFNLLFSGLEVLLNLLLVLPVPFLVGGTALVVVCVLYKVLGRENQS